MSNPKQVSIRHTLHLNPPQQWKRKRHSQDFTGYDVIELKRKA